MVRPRLAASALCFVLGTSIAGCRTDDRQHQRDGYDNTGSVIPGVTVTASGPALMGVQTAITNVRAVSLPGAAARHIQLSYELAGSPPWFGMPSSCRSALPATVPVQMQVASLQETVTVSGASPVVDVRTRISRTTSPPKC